jgi:hypothetical protein
MTMTTLLDRPSVAGGLTLDEALAGALDALDRGQEGACVVCGGEAFPVQRRSGVVAQVCRSCGSMLERPDVPAGVERRG